MKDLPLQMPLMQPLRDPRRSPHGSSDICLLCNSQITPPINGMLFIGRKRVYPLSPLLGGGFPKEGGDACSTVNSFCTGGGCAAQGEVSQSGCLSTFSRRPANFGRPGANNPLARGEQSEPRTAENAPQNQSFIQFIGRKRVYPLSPLLGGGFPKEGGDPCGTILVRILVG